MKICTNGVFPNLKLQAALASAHNAKAIFHDKETAKNLAGMCTKASGRLRMLASKYRDLAVFQNKYDTCMAKAGGLQNNFRAVWKCC